MGTLCWIKVHSGYPSLPIRTCTYIVSFHRNAIHNIRALLNKVLVPNSIIGGLVLTVSDYWLVIRKRWGLMAFVTLLCIAGAFCADRVCGDRFHRRLRQGFKAKESGADGKEKNLFPDSG